MAIELSEIRDFTILIVEDDPTCLDLMQAYLRDSFPNVVTATDGEQALAAIAEHVPDLVLLDVGLPRLNGYEVCRRIRGSPRTAHASVVMVTGLGGVADVECAVEAGADDFLTKPIYQGELLLRVRSLLRLRYLRRELDATLALIDRPKSDASPKPPEGQGNTGKP